MHTTGFEGYYEAPLQPWQVTRRKPAVMARHYGFPGMSALIADIPEETSVIDVGAGDSRFGDVIAEHRPDVRVVKFSDHYRAEQTGQQTSNLEVIRGDITAVPLELHGQFDRVYSYWMLRHISLNDPNMVQDETSPGRLAARGLLALLAPEGVLRVGPARHIRSLRQPQHDTLAIQQSAGISPIVEQAIVQATLGPSSTSRSLS